MAKEDPITMDQITEEWNRLKAGRTMFRSDPRMLDATLLGFDENVRRMAQQEQARGIQATPESILRAIPTDDGKGVRPDDVRQLRHDSFVALGKEYSGRLRGMVESGGMPFNNGHLTVSKHVSYSQKYSGLGEKEFDDAIGSKQSERDQQELVLSQRVVKRAMGELSNDDPEDDSRALMEVRSLVDVDPDPARLFADTGFRYQDYREKQTAEYVRNFANGMARIISTSSLRSPDGYAANDIINRCGLTPSDFIDRLKKELTQNPELAGKDKQIDLSLEKLKKGMELAARDDASPPVPHQERLQPQVAP